MNMERVNNEGDAERERERSWFIYQVTFSGPSSVWGWRVKKGSKLEVVDVS